MQWRTVFQSDRLLFTTALTALGCAAMLSGCNGRGEDRLKSPIVATVNDRPITVSQLKQVMKTAGEIAPVQAIESLVNEELLVQGAENEQMERDTAVAQAIETSRRQILARAFAERDIYRDATVSLDDAHKFFEANPILFAKRKRFVLKDFLFEGTGLDSPLTAALENVHSDIELRALLDRNNITYTTQADSISADHLPVDKLSDFAHASVGDVLAAHQGNNKALLMLITDIRDDAPLTFDRAKPYIDAYLSNMHNRQVLSDYLSRAKAGANIVYADDMEQEPIGIKTHDRGLSSLTKADVK